MQQAEMPQQYDDPNQGSGQYRGGLVREHHMYGDSVGDGSDMQYDDQKGYMGFLGLGSAQQLSPQQLQSEQKDMSEGKMPSQPPSGAAQMLKGATDIYSLGKDASGLYDKAMSALKSVTGTPATDAASNTLAPSAASSAAPVTQTAVDAAAPAVTDAATAAAPAAADVGAGAVADAGLDAAADVGAGAIADAGIGAAADVGLGAAASDLAPLLMFASRGGVIPREHHDGPNDTNNQSNVVGDGQTDTSAQTTTSNNTDQSAPDQSNQVDLSKLPRNWRNNNPGNITDGEFAQSMPGYVGSDGRFAVFKNVENGYGAMDNLLSNYAKKGLVTPTDIISKWAPSKDNNNVPAYAGSVAKQLGIGPNDAIDMSDPNARRQLAMAMAHVEGGNPPSGQTASMLSGLSGAITGGLGKAAHAVSDLFTPSQANAQTPNQQGGQQQQGTDWEKIIVPLLSGIGGMANSNSRYLGAAILQGLGAGANAYENVLTNQASRPGVQAQSQSYEIGALNNLMNSWQNYRAINGTNISLQDYAKMIGYKGGIPNQQINSNINGASGKPNAVSGAGQQYNYSVPEMQTATISRNGTNIPAFNDPFYLTQFIAHNSTSTSPNVVNAVKAAQTQLASINSTGTSIGEEGYTPAPGALSTKRQSDVSNAITQNITNQYNSAREFEANYDQTNQLLKYAAEYSRLANMNVATPELANAIGKLRSIPGFDKYITPDMATTQGATNAATKNAVLSAFQTLQENAGPAQKAVLQEANQVVAHPELSPEARYEIITGAQAKLDREHARNQAWISNADPKTGNYPEPLSFFQQWDQQSQNSPDAFAKQAREKIPPFAGQTKILSTNSQVQQFTPEVGKIYIDANGNRARWNGSNYVKVQ